MRVALPLFIVSAIIALAHAETDVGVCPLPATLQFPTCAQRPLEIPPIIEALYPPGFEAQEHPDEVVPGPTVSVTASPLAQATSGHSKYNYASPDCGARVHSSSKLSQHASSVLHKSRDRYMLTPCKASEHWVTIELCDEVRVEAIEISVFEFFSGIVREVRVSAGEEEGEQVEVGTFVGKNVRGAQTFTLPTPTSFYRFLRLDFPSYYGSEYYCPVSQIKVYGMNQLEAFKWEQKRIVDKPEVEEELLVEEAVAQRVEEEIRERELGELEKLVRAQARHNITEEVPGRRADSESIYAFIIRRVNDLEGNSSLVARYIDEQARAMRTMLDRTERDLLQRSEDKTRWEQERMRQEDRLGRIFSQLEQQRLVLDLDRRKIESQLRILADELGFERRRGIAQIFILIVIIVLGVASRSNTIDALLKPLLAEARRRKKSLQTPKRRTPIPRSVSSVDFPLSPRPRSTLPRPHNGFSNRRIARNAHLHAIKKDQVDWASASEVEDVAMQDWNASN